MRQAAKKLGMRARLVLFFGAALLAAMLGTTVAINHYSRNFIKKLLEQNNIQQMKEINDQLNGLYDKVNQIFITFNSQPLYSMFLHPQGMGSFQRMKQQLDVEGEIKEAINANNLQSAINGAIFYVNGEDNAYVGHGTMEKGFQVNETDWYKKFQGQKSLKLVYGPLMEDFRPRDSTKSQALYYMRAWNVPASSGLKPEGTPFILFSINMDYVLGIFEKHIENQDAMGFLITDGKGGRLASINLDPGQESQVGAVVGKQGGILGRPGTYLSKDWFVAGVPNESLGWQVYSVESTREAFRDMDRMIGKVNLLILGIGLAAMALSVFFSRRIMMPITLLNRLISTIEEDNDAFIQVKGDDELAQIGNRFNQMKRKLQTMGANMYFSKVQEKEAQLSALQSQINPHFLYNTLDNIYCIAQIEEVDAIVRLSENLSAMMRYSMDMKKHRVPLIKEIQHVEAYVDIINVRFDHSITLDFLIEKSVEDAQILKLTLQPLVENAWNHGLLPKPGHKGTIRIKVEGRGDDLLVTVEDDGAGITLARSQEVNRQLAQLDYGATDSVKGFGVALKNVNNRIKLSDGPGYGITLHPLALGGCRVVMKIRLRRTAGGNNHKAGA